VEAALASGVTTMVGGGTGPAAGSKATGCTPGPWHLDRMIRASEAFPMNLAFAGKGNASLPAALEEQVRAGAAALDLDADWGIGPAAIDCCLAIADEFDVQVSIRADALNESGFVEDAIAAFAGRTIRAVLAGGVPEHAKLVALVNVLPASGPSSVDEPGSTAAEDVLHDIGAISMTVSGGWAPGRTGDVLIRAWQAAHRMKLQRGSLPEDGDGRSDNFRVKRYVAKYTINPAIAHGLDEWVGSVTIGKLADLVVWSPAFFGVKPELVIKMGSIAAAPADPSGEYRPMFGAFGKATIHSAVTFVSQAAAADGLAEVLGMERRLLPVRHTRGITKESMIHNAAMPAIEIDPETSALRADGEVLASAPAETLPLAQRYFLF
jgi:urease subunit alpha